MSFKTLPTPQFEGGRFTRPHHGIIDEMAKKGLKTSDFSAVADLDSGATDAEVISKVNAMLAILRGE